MTAILLFYVVGDTWTQVELRAVFTVGVALLLPSLIIVFLFNDSYALTNKDGTPDSNTAVSELNDAQTEKKMESGYSDEQILRELVEPLLQEEEKQGAGKQHTSESSSTFDTAAHYWIPRIVVGSDLLVGFASGMTVKFFPLFFKEESLMSPIEVSAVYVATFFLIALFSYFARTFAAKIGRARALLLIQTPGTFLLMSMYLMSVGHDIKEPGQVPLWRNKAVIIPVFLIRTALMNSVPPIKRSILMDYVPSKNRGVWSAFDSLTRFGKVLCHFMLRA